MWKGVGASFIYRSCFAAMFGGTSNPDLGLANADSEETLPFAHYLRVRGVQSVVQDVGRDAVGDVPGNGQLYGGGFGVQHVLADCPA